MRINFLHSDARDSEKTQNLKGDDSEDKPMKKCWSPFIYRKVKVIRGKEIFN